MKATEFIKLVHKMRDAQKAYYKAHPHLERERKKKLLAEAKQLESQVDNADIEDPANLEIDFPSANERLADG